MNLERERIEFILDKWRRMEHTKQVELTDILLKTWDAAFDGDIWGEGKVKDGANIEKVMLGLQALWKAI
jgi:hypothetical protein